MKALVIGGSGPTGVPIVNGLITRGYDVTVVHRGSHEVDYDEDVRHLHTDAHFFGGRLGEELGSERFDVTVSAYGRLGIIAQELVGHTDAIVGITGFGVYSGWAPPWGDWGSQARFDMPVPTPETHPVAGPGELDFSQKIARGEQTVIDNVRSGKYAGVIVRYPSVYGPRAPAGREWCILRRLLDGRRQIIVPDGGLQLETVGYAANVAHGVLLSIERMTEVSGEIFNLGDEGSAPSLSAWIFNVARAIGSEVELVSVPWALAEPTRRYAKFNGHRVCDVSKAIRLLGYSDKVKPSRALEVTCAWYLANRPVPGGELEKQLGDVFDYETEDMIIRSVRGVVDDVAPRLTRFEMAHAYPHPKKS